ncbi:hypothetical protein D3C75_700450 [compost metagenome]
MQQALVGGHRRADAHQVSHLGQQLGLALGQLDLHGGEQVSVELDTRLGPHLGDGAGEEQFGLGELWRQHAPHGVGQVGVVDAILAVLGQLVVGEVAPALAVGAHHLVALLQRPT